MKDNGKGMLVPKDSNSTVTRMRRQILPVVAPPQERKGLLASKWKIKDPERKLEEATSSSSADSDYEERQMARRMQMDSGLDR